MMKRFNRDIRGDSLIEVILATGVLALIIMVGWVTMSRLTRASYYARTRVEIVNKLKAQSEILRTMNKNDVTNKPIPAITEVEAAKVFCPLDQVGFDQQIKNGSGSISNPFYIDDDGKVQPGMKSYNDDNTMKYWIQYTQDVSNPSRYRDYYVRACWLTDNSKQPTDNSQVILRVTLP